MSEIPRLYTSEQIEAMLKKMPKEQVEQLRKIAADPQARAKIDAAGQLAYRAMLAREDSPEGYSHFHYCVFGMELPKHGREWIETIYRAREQKKAGAIIEAFRESGKTTTVTVGFSAFRIGQEPHRANLLVQVGDAIAKDNTKQVADIIANNPGWRKVFPHVIPDRELGWGDSGYEVKRSDMDYSEWRKLNAKRKDPSLVGLGYGSNALIGKHPDGVLVIDDILDESNTSSEVELKGVMKIVNGTLMYTPTETTWTIWVGTPWNDHDVIAFVKSTGEYCHIMTPGYVEKDGVRVYTWPELRGEEWCERKRRTTVPPEFARMVLLDLTKIRAGILKYQSYPSDKINLGWPIYGGVDYASVFLPTRHTEGKRSHFALCYLVLTPMNMGVIYDGVLVQCSQAEAETHIVTAQDMYPEWVYSVVEGDGKGEEFIALQMRNPAMKIVPMKTGGKGKHERLYKEMSPLFQSGRIRISDAETPYLNALRRFFEMYPDLDKTAKEWDAADAAYWAIRGCPLLMVTPNTNTGIAVARKPLVPSPWRGVNP